ncbi:SST2 [Candida theae]|uniref:SST2 n=1 Tax=Candida theae TaxID=1198502 RepID=A0AAD5BHF8_9ASCO|nr:SST2 [Candida theae]KAI5963352.1 SST2 [Candida theae]
MPALLKRGSSSVLATLRSHEDFNGEVHSILHPPPQIEKSLSSSSSLDLPGTFVNDPSAKPSSNVLHEAVAKRFNRTSSGKIYEKDLRDIFATLIISLQLSNNSSSTTSASSSSKRRKNLKRSSLYSSPLSKIRLTTLSKKHPYSFRLSSAIEQMAHLRVEIDSSNTITCLSYSFQSEIACTLIRQFYKAKLLHSPADRTRAEPKQEVLLQPTPKGLAVVQSFCEKVGMKKSSMPEVLLQKSYNTMQLFHFDRDQVTDKVIYSKSLIQLLFAKLLGPSPNVWSPMNKPDPISYVVDKEEFNFGKDTEDFPFHLQTQDDFDVSNKLSSSPPVVSKPANPFSFVKYQKKNLEASQTFSDDASLSNAPDVSPFHHRYFSNPESDAHIQYYVSSVGVRLKKEKQADGAKPKSQPQAFYYLINGKAIVQWLMDCTDLVRPKHALEIAGLFLSQKLIKSCKPYEGSLIFQKEHYYYVDEKGLSFCMWNRSVVAMSALKLSIKNSPFRPEVTLDAIMQDPGLRFQFKSHLESEFCLENFDAYCQLQTFQANVKLWNDFLDSSDLEQDAILNKSTLQHQISLRDMCMSIAYQIYNTYISDDSPSMLNIDYSLRSQVVELLTGVANGADCNGSDLKTYMQTPTEESSSERRDTSQKRLSTADENNVNQVLKELGHLFNDISAHLYKMMQVDSLPKFLSSLDKI